MMHVNMFTYFHGVWLKVHTLTIMDSKNNREMDNTYAGFYKVGFHLSQLKLIHVYVSS